MKQYKDMMKQIHPDRELLEKTKEAMHKQPTMFPISKGKVACLVAMVIVLAAGTGIQHLQGNHVEEDSDATAEAYEQVINTTNFTPQYATQLTQYKEVDTSSNISKEENMLSSFLVNSSSYVLQEQKNTIYSPLSASYALAMLYSGADGASKKELANLFQMNQVEIEQYLQRLYQRNKIDNLSIVNSFWFDNRYHVKQENLQKIADIYYANSYATDFSNQAAMKELNDYVYKESKEMIQANYQANNSLAMKVLNITALESTWVHRFVKAEEETTFSLLDGTTISYQPMFNFLENPYYLKTDSYEMSDLYLENGCKLRIVLPNENTSLDSLIQKKKTLQDIMETTLTKKANTQLHLEMPSFTISNTIDLDAYLREEKVTSMFSASDDFKTFGKGLFVSQVEQQAYIDVNEYGLRAAAKTDISVTGIAGATRIEQIEMIVNRPFLYMVLSPQNDVLFIGTVYQP